MNQTIQFLSIYPLYPLLNYLILYLSLYFLHFLGVFSRKPMAKSIHTELDFLAWTRYRDFGDLNPVGRKAVCRGVMVHSRFSSGRHRRTKTLPNKQWPELMGLSGKHLWKGFYSCYIYIYLDIFIFIHVIYIYLHRYMTIYYPLLVFVLQPLFEEHLTFVPCFGRGF